MSITPEIVDPDYTFIKLEVFFKYDPNLTSLTAGELKDKVIATIKSCKTKSQLEGASSMVRNFKNLYKRVGYPKVLSTFPIIHPSEPDLPK